ncbi:hypothetical protein A8C56_02485 [Niabella ginsenosidivorans]|uniref:BD-FAE-like domain-containing protein n=1 Tax=Niabella ginsenosidivorans TaxID=1176587 RepID=A0A1A9HXM8_9BACT|nr:alpha/beta hydrolase [Niabella ginsenosidivorans]ANH79993.1 hypothetical protein A8C56_02485 [Niabella ginsenosidivorans]
MQRFTADLFIQKHQLLTTTGFAIPFIFNNYFYKNPLQMKPLPVLLFFLLLFKTAVLNAQQEYKNLPYKRSENGNALMLDLFLPEPTAAGKKFPVVLIIHGGAWVEGDRSLETFYYTQQLKKQLNKTGIAVVSIDYTLLSKTIHLPVPIADCKDAVRWVRAHAEQYGFDPENIGLWGGSAGGHLALLTAYTDDTKWPGSPQLASFSARTNYVIDFFGPTDLNALLKPDAGWFTVLLAKIFIPKLLPYREKLAYALTGYSIDPDKQKVMQTAGLYTPLKYITAATVPTFIFHGTKDRVVPLRQSRKLHRMLDANKVSNGLIIVKKGDHGFNNIPKEKTDALVEKTVTCITGQARE